MRTTVANAHTAIANRTEFTAGAMQGRIGRYGTGILPYDWASTFYRDTADGKAFIVYSYKTPIAWERSDGTRVMPNVRYSVTTGKHQTQVRAAWDHRYTQEYSNPVVGLLAV
jgi:hypothetical protein